MKQQDAIALLKADHKTVKALFKEELTVHAQIEEQIFDPAVKQSAGKKHALVKHVIG